MNNDKILVTHKLYSFGEHVGFAKPVRSRWWKRSTSITVLDTDGDALGQTSTLTEAFNMALWFKTVRNDSRRRLPL